MKPVVYIHTNDKQFTGAVLSKHSLITRSSNPDSFEVRFLRLEETPHLLKRDGQEYLRKGRKAVWKNDDLQSFSPLRMMVPQLMGFKGRALVIDPDVFAVGDVCELLNRDMGGKAVMCRHVMDGYRGNGHRFYASSVMLLDCEKLSHWQWDKQIDDMFNMKHDYGPWISLLMEPEENIGEIEEEWNHFDTLNECTKLLHNTERSTQPWKTGLPVDYDTTWAKKKKAAQQSQPVPASKIERILTTFSRHWKKDDSGIEYYKPHPDTNQEKFFFTLLNEALDSGIVTNDFLKSEIKKRHIRPDILSAMSRHAA